MQLPAPLQQNSARTEGHRYMKALHIRSSEESRALPATRITRDSFTWLAYLLLGYYAYLQAVLGPAMPFLRNDLHINHTVGSLHVSAFALGMIIAGLVGDRLARRYGRRRIFWGGAVGMALGAVCLALARTPALTIAAALLMGALGSLLLILIQSTLADRHGSGRAIALTEANVVASICASLAPVLVGTFQRSGTGWRGALFAAVAVLGVLALYGRRIALPAQPLTPSVAQVTAATVSRHSERALPAMFWAYWVLTLFCVAIEWCVAVWSADFLHDVGGLSVVNAASVLGVFFVAEVIGRVIGSRLTHSRSSISLLLLALVVTLAGFPLLWLAPAAPLRIMGLLVTGLGVANLFPLTLAAATGISPRNADRASSRVALAAGIAIFTAPLLLGRLADTIGIQRAYGIIALLVVLGLATAGVAGRLHRAG